MRKYAFGLWRKKCLQLASFSMVINKVFDAGYHVSQLGVLKFIFNYD